MNNDYDTCQENVIEWLKGQRTCVVTFTNQKHINKIKKLYEEYKDDFVYYKENKDGSICAKIPLKWIKINNSKRNAEHEYTEEEKEALRERIKKAQAARKSKKENKNN